MKGMQSICNGNIAVFVEKEGIEIGTRVEAVRKSNVDGGADRHVSPVTWEELKSLISLLTDIEAWYVYDEMARKYEGKA